MTHRGGRSPRPSTETFYANRVPVGVSELDDQDGPWPATERAEAPGGGWGQQRGRPEGCGCGPRDSRGPPLTPGGMLLRVSEKQVHVGLELRPLALGTGDAAHLVLSHPVGGAWLLWPREAGPQPRFLS